MKRIVNIKSNAITNEICAKKEHVLIYSEIHHFNNSRAINSPLTLLYNYLNIYYTESFDIEVEFSLGFVKTSVIYANRVYYDEMIDLKKLHNIDDCLFFKVYWLFFDGKFETSDREAINLLLSEVSDIQNELNKS
ncbi:hypothetical protein IF125_11490 [Empedobacter stercoris]|uniref:hypothetical protein n=1 Tax=Empedobacter stercoris TaxID=1628248 RepID=UPI001CE1F56E|nr:hypothetical protein [Empedobacter stercoris]MCA4782868.1 hypothetical protein [Empedobacter stercoris]